MKSLNFLQPTPFILTRYKAILLNKLKYKLLCNYYSYFVGLSVNLSSRNENKCLKSLSERSGCFSFKLIPLFELIMAVVGRLFKTAVYYR